MGSAVQAASARRTGGGRVGSGARCADGQLRIAVQDEGPGLPANVREGLRQATRGDGLGPVELGPGTAGAGGGLANVVQRLALRYRGAARIEATDCQPGTRIELRIPT